MRQVEVFEWVYDAETGRFSDKPAGKGIFHQFGVEIAENDFGIGTYSIALVERENGRIESIPVNLVRFLDGGEW